MAFLKALGSTRKRPVSAREPRFAGERNATVVLEPEIIRDPFDLAWLFRSIRNLMERPVHVMVGGTSQQHVFGTSYPLK